MSEHMDVDSEVHEFENLTQPEKEKKRDEEIEKIIKIFELIAAKLPNVEKPIRKRTHEITIIDLDISNQISGVVATVFTYLRKSSKNNSSQTADKYKDYEAKVSDVSIKISELANEVTEAGIKIDFLVATPIMNLMTAFKCFFDEVRTGVTKFPVREEDSAKMSLKRKRPTATTSAPRRKRDDIQHRNLTDYGLNNNHIPLLQGITLPPERRTGLLRSIGPMSQAILLINEKTYFNKIENALRCSLQMLPMKEEIISALRMAKSPGSLSGLMKELGDLLIITTSRATQKIFYPLALWVHIWQNKGAAKVTFSGMNAQAIFSYFCSKGKLKFQMKSKGTSEAAKQIVFHAMYGTYLDDISILSEITNYGQWEQRYKLSDAFSKRSTGTHLAFEPIYLKRFSKMSQALQTKTLGNIEPSSTSRPSFSGNRTRTFSNEFQSYLKTGKSLSTFSSDPVSLQFAVRALKDELMRDLNSDKIIMTGTTEWYIPEGDSFVADPTFRVVEKGVYFYGTC